ncbi:unnamed protein product [Cyclocybe aegerita]|uniref:Uncharacterized protein n=1 Tax=Cyclocybe aegerita TaxID=1973307 RepID=A0A8S0VV38_CYCAE|nr:unnamed protein product [Cyclocybe aegerita]
MRLTFLTFILSASYQLTAAGTLGENETCSTGNSRLQTGTFQFWSECNSITYCSARGICEPKGCRKDDFPFGYPQGSDNIPPKCERGEFCPDEASNCQPILPQGSACQLNRDDQCEAPPNFQELADISGRGLNFNGSVCLNNVCLWANATVGTRCIFENTPYIAYGVGGEFIDIVSRDNCRVGLYCDSATQVCIQNKLLGDACTADKECESWNCLSTGVCGVPAATPRHFGVWVYVLVALGIIGGMAGTLTGLYVTHRKQREIERAKRAQYWKEQNAFHQNLMQMRETARASIPSLNRGGDYSRDDDSQTPILHSAETQKSSGLRHYMANNDSSDFDDGLEMRGTKDNRF